MLDHTPTATAIAELLTRHNQSVAVAESSSGGLVSASLLAIPRASTWYLGGAVVYTKTARDQLVGISDADMQGLRSASEPYAELLANRIRQQHGSDWGLAETGAAGPTGNRYGDQAGHCCIAIAGPLNACITIETASADRAANMHTFTAKVLDSFLSTLRKHHAG